MAKAILDNKTLAESDDFEVVEGNIYFPPGSVKTEYFKKKKMIHHTHVLGKAFLNIGT